MPCPVSAGEPFYNIPFGTDLFVIGRGPETDKGQCHRNAQVAQKGVGDKVNWHIYWTGYTYEAIHWQAGNPVPADIIELGSDPYYAASTVASDLATYLDASDVLPMTATFVPLLGGALETLREMSG